MARKGRKDYKVAKRKLSLGKIKFDQKTKATWSKLITSDMVSSEDEEIQDNEKTFVTRPKPNRPAKVSKFFQKLDEVDRQTMATTSRFRANKRVKGNVSENEISFSKEHKEAMASLEITYN
uniref:Uncharacterized protein n=1 Tax=Clytia hemisphaerica TaxID=252671 RepID=A0A7M5X8V4_9CNID